MALLTTHAVDAEYRDAALADPSALTVLLLCAAWCDACRAFRGTAQRLADTHPDATFVWLDVEDDEAVVGDVDVENFPTLAIVRGDTVLHFGVTLPHEGGIARLIEAMRTQAAPASAQTDAVRGLPARLRSMAPSD